MAYVKNTWATGDKITAAKMNHLEDGVAGAEGAVVSVNGQTGAVVLDANDVSAASVSALAHTNDALDALFKLTRGQAWDIVQDNTTAYQKTIPSGTHLSVLNGWGGKSIVWNQMIPIPGTNISKTENGVTFTDNRDGSYTVYTTASGASAATSLAIPGTYSLGDQNLGKVLVRGCPPNGSASTYGLKTEYFEQTFSDYGSGSIYENTTQYIAGNVVIAVKQGTIITTPITFKPQWFYITQMFGAGNEPSTVEQFRALFPADYYPYNAGETMHGDVTGIVLKNDQQTTVQTLTVPASVRALTGYGQTGSAVTYNAGAKTWAYTYNGVTTDITDLMADFENYLNEAEPGGTLTFVNSHGADYGIPVPSQIDNYRNLSEVTP